MSGRRNRRTRKPRKPREPGLSAAAVARAQREFDKNKRLVDSGETFAAQPPPFVRKGHDDGRR